MNQSKTLQNMFAYLSAAMLSMCAVTSSSAQIGAMLGGGLAFSPFNNEIKIEGKVGKENNIEQEISCNDLKKLNSSLSGDIFMAFVYIMNTSYVNVMFALGAEIKFPQQKFGQDKEEMMVVSENFGAFAGVGVMYEKVGHVLLRLSANRRNYDKGTSKRIFSEIKSSSKWAFEVSLQTCLYLIKQSFIKVGPALTLGYTLNGKQEHTDVDLTAHNDNDRGITFGTSEKFTSKYNPATVKVGVIAVLTF
jgi:hypothetical protein